MNLLAGSLKSKVSIGLLLREMDTELLFFMISEEIKSGFVATGGEDGVNGKVFMIRIILIYKLEHLR